MSYARLVGDSDVYVYLHVNGSLCCQVCLLLDGRVTYHAGTTEEMLGHLEAHKLNGDRVPDSCIEGLIEDREENDKFIREYKFNADD